MVLKFLRVDHSILLERCRRQERQAQQILYEQYAPQMLGVCRRYLVDPQASEDAMIKGFYKVFSQLNRLHDDEKFFGWMHRIFVNECLMEIRKRNRRPQTEPIEWDHAFFDSGAIARLSEMEILAAIETLPDGYRTVFNLYVIEGFSHKEIADLLGVSVNTSKSQLIMARRKLQQIISENHLGDYNQTSENQN